MKKEKERRKRKDSISFHLVKKKAKRTDDHKSKNILNEF